jgi:hypothetical protein
MALSYPLAKSAFWKLPARENGKKRREICSEISYTKLAASLALRADGPLASWC